MRVFTDDDAHWVRGYVDEVDNVLRARIAPQRVRFADSERLFQRLLDARDAVLQHGWAQFAAIDEAHNEICVAIGILEMRDPSVTRLQYEPSLEGTARSIDFVAEYAGSPSCYIDVKTIAPRSRDRWEQYARAQDDGWLPEHATVTLLKEWLGGELWHNRVAARSRMLEYTVQLEEKLTAARLSAPSDCVLLVLCSNGFHWHQDELEDFAAFYFSGTHRSDDPLAKMELMHLQQKAVRISRCVRHFAYLERSSGAALPTRLNWHVVAPPMPF